MDFEGAVVSVERVRGRFFIPIKRHLAMTPEL
jgi:hypothetical protein